MWCNEQVDKARQGKLAGFKAYKALKKGGRAAEVKEAETAHNDAKCVTKHTIWQAKFEAEKEEFAQVSTDGDDVFSVAIQMDHTNQDIIGENCVRNDAGEFVITDEDKIMAWVERYARVLNIVFE